MRTHALAKLKATLVVTLSCDDRASACKILVPRVARNKYAVLQCGIALIER
jgi:hypothetical protein